MSGGKFNEKLQSLVTFPDITKKPWILQKRIFTEEEKHYNRIDVFFLYVLLSKSLRISLKLRDILGTCMNREECIYTS